MILCRSWALICSLTSPSRASLATSFFLTLDRSHQHFSLRSRLLILFFFFCRFHLKLDRLTGSIVFPPLYHLVHQYTTCFLSLCKDHTNVLMGAGADNSSPRRATAATTENTIACWLMQYLFNCRVSCSHARTLCPKLPFVLRVLCFSGWKPDFSQRSVQFLEDVSFPV